jgi:hypothetical protein
MNKENKKPRYKVIKPNAKIPVIAGSKTYLHFNEGHELDCQHLTLQMEFDKLVANGILLDTQAKKIEATANEIKSPEEVVEKKKTNI